MQVFRQFRCLWLAFLVGGAMAAGDVVTSGLFRGSPAMLRSVPALNIKTVHSLLFNSMPQTVEASVRTKKRKSSSGGGNREIVSGTGFYYGIPESSIHGKRRKPLHKSMEEAFQELKEMRHEMDTLRRELIAMKRKLGEDVSSDLEHHQQHGVSALVARRKRQREFDRIGIEVEQWAEKLLFEEGGEEDGWSEIRCNKLVRNKFNHDGRIKCYLKWMKDSRGEHGNADDESEYPCVKVYSTIDAPMEEVCAYLAQEARIPEYNDLVVKNRDLEEVTPHSKICWGHTPQILFIKPRDLVTFCHHRWLRDGTQVVVNQACEHPDAPGNHKESDGKFCRAFALRGANFISPDPEDPNKTRMALLAHANPGGGIPHWGVKTAVGVVAPIEPFKLFHRINENVKRIGPQLERTEMVHTTHGRSNQPAGLSQMGYACFWPEGGGLKEGLLHSSHPDHVNPTDEHEDEDEVPLSKKQKQKGAMEDHETDEDKPVSYSKKGLGNIFPPVVVVDARSIRIKALPPFPRLG